jgi:hypothetical protein
MPRSALSAISLPSPQHYPETKNGIKSRKRVTFDGKGIHSGCIPLTLALSLADKHETRPTIPKMSTFTETLQVCSASGWSKITLQAFGVEFHKEVQTPLNTLIRDPKWYDEYTEDEDFVKRKPLFLRSTANSSIPEYYL